MRQLDSGQMPPPGEPRPPVEQRNAVLAQLRSALDEAALADRREGRVRLRRLNRVEYENTVRDLFQVDVDVRDLLPEDAVSQGFDNVGAALTISPVLIERYLDAADVVLNAAVRPVHSQASQTASFDLYDSLPKWFVAGVWKQESGVILFRNGGDSATDLRQFRAPVRGRYRFRIHASAHNSKTPLPMSIAVGNFVVSGNPTWQLGYFDAPAGPPTVVELEALLHARNDTIKVAPVSLPFVYLKHETMPQYPGPGLHIHRIEVEGPLPEVWPSASYRRVYGDVDPSRGTLDDAATLIREFLPRAFRRPVEPGSERPYVALVAQALESGQTFDAALRVGLKAVLASPRFLYLQENAGNLDDHALASRLSYFLWSSPPDETLMELANRKQLRDPGVLRNEVERLLQHPESRAFTEHFTGQWLSLREINATTPDRTLYPEFDELLQWSAVEETRQFFDRILRENLSVRNFVDSDFAMLNGRLARHYGIPDVHGVAFRRVPLRPEYHRGGILTHASVLKVTANGTTTSPVIRGVWILDRILGRPVAPPPPNVPAVEPDIRGATTIRDQLARHRATENCAGCHTRIDPPGFALENYDVIGGWRDRYRVIADQKNWVQNRVGPLGKYLAAYRYGLGAAVEAGDTLPDGRSFASLEEFKALLLERPDEIARCITEKLVTYATGEPAGYLDDRIVRQIVDQSRESDYGLRSLIHGVVASDLFLRK